MPGKDPEIPDLSRQRQMALSRWDSERGAGPCGSQMDPNPNGTPFVTPELTNAELVQLRIRVIALENVVISLLAQASDR